VARAKPAFGAEHLSGKRLVKGVMRTFSDSRLAWMIHEHAQREAGRDPSSGAGERSGCVTHSPESPPSGRRTGRGGPTLPERSPAPAATRPDRTCGTRE